MKDHAISPDGPRRPALPVFDLHESLSDMSPLASPLRGRRSPPNLTQTWFAEPLRDGFALTVSGDVEPFARLGAEMRLRLDVPEGLNALADSISGSSP